MERLKTDIFRLFKDNFATFSRFKCVKIVLG